MDTEPSLSSADELLRQFYAWEFWGRGWFLWDHAIEPEPPFRPFFGHWVSDERHTDDGRKATFLSGLFEWLHRKIRGSTTVPASPDFDLPEFDEPVACVEPSGLTELHVVFPPDLKVTREASAQFLLSLAACARPIAFELLGTADAISLQFVCDQVDADHVQSQLEAAFPDVTCQCRIGYLQRHWPEYEKGTTAVAEFGFARECMLPLATANFGSADPLSSVAAALSDVHPGELSLLQVLFRPTRHPWAESILRSVTFADSTPFFAGLRDFVGQAKAKVSRPLFGAVIRTCCRSPDSGRAWELARRLSGALAPLGDPEGNELIPLDNEGYDAAEHEHDVLLRRSRRCGVLLSCDELVSLVHLPSESVRSSKLRGSSQKTKAAPSLVRGHRLVLGENEHAGQTQPVTLSPEQRANHIHIIGASGTGKSTLLLQLIIQDIKNGDGVAVLDPHGDLVDAVLRHLPAERVEDVVLFDPADEEYPVGFNILSASSDPERNLLASDLVAVFRRLSTSWGDQMNAVLSNAIIAFLESSRGGTLLDLRRFLVEPAFRKEFLATVTDPEVLYYWTKEFPLLSGKPHGPVLTRLNTFLRPKPVRYMVGQRQGRLDFADVMDRKRIFLARLSHGAIGEENAQLLGTLLVSKFHQLALGRQRQKESDRSYFWLYVDEFQNFATPSMAAMLSGARKYRLGLVLAHQDLYQLQRQSPDVASAVATNPYTRVCFRLGDDDAKKLAGGFSYFDAADLQNLGRGSAICRVERAELDFNLRTLPLPVVDGAAATAVRERALARSREKYASPRAAVEAQFVLARNGTLSDAAATHHQEAEEAPEQSGATAVPMAAKSEPATRPARTKRPAAPSTEPASMGRGGPEHIYLQRLIKQYAEGLGYRAGIEEQVLGGRSIDVALVKGDTSIACEICMTTDDDHELENVRKCLAAAYTHTVVVTPAPERLRRLERAISSQLTAEERGRVKFFVPDELFGFIRDLEVQQLNSEGMVKGYRVRTTFQSVDDMKHRREAVSHVVAASLQRMSKRRRT